jgi:arsenate reductase
MAGKRKATTAATTTAATKKAKPTAVKKTPSKATESSTAANTDGLRVYGYKPCSTCRNALKWLTAHDIPHESIEITKTPPDVAELTAVSETLGRAAVLNMNGNVAKKIGKAKLEAMDDEEAFGRASKDGMLCKRPFLIGSHEGKVIHVTGFRVAEWEAAFDQ